MMTTKASPLLKKKESGNNMLEILTRKTTKNTMNNQKEITLKKNQIVNYLTTPSNMRVQTLPDVSGLEFDSLRKNFNHMHNKKTKLPDKKNSKSSKEETIFKNDPTSSHSNIRETSSNLRENNMSKPSSDYNYRKDDQKSLAERDLSNHSVKSSYSVNMVRKPIVKNPNVNDKTANYTMHISKEKVFRENEGLNLNEKLLFHVRMNEFDKMMDLLEKNKMNKLINFNYKGENDWAALHYACLNGNSKILNIFLYNEAFIDCETTSKLTPLMIACQKLLFLLFK